MTIEKAIEILKNIQNNIRLSWLKKNKLGAKSISKS